MNKIGNKFSGKDVSANDLKNKFPLIAKKTLIIELNLSKTNRIW